MVKARTAHAFMTCAPPRSRTRTSIHTQTTWEEHMPHSTCAQDARAGSLDCTMRFNRLCTANGRHRWRTKPPAHPLTTTKDRQQGCRYHRNHQEPRTTFRQNSTQLGSSNNPPRNLCMAKPPCKTMRTLLSGLARNPKHPWRCKGRRNRPVAHKTRNCRTASRPGSPPKRERKRRHTLGAARRALQSPTLPWPRTAPPDLERLHLQSLRRRCSPPRGRHWAACRRRSPFPRASLTAAGRCWLERFGRRPPTSTPTLKQNGTCWNRSLDLNALV
jgi:hypothetical protein